MSQNSSRALRSLALVLPLVLVASLAESPDAFGHEAHDKLKKTAAIEHHPRPVDTPRDDTVVGPATTHQHDDSAHHEDAKGVPKLLAWLGKFHLAAVNFPVALLTAGALAELLWLRTQRELFFHAARFCVWGGATGALVAGLLGWFFAGFQLADDEWTMTTHRWLGTSTAAWAIVVLVLCERAYRSGRRRAFRLALGAGMALVGATGFFGGALVYGLDHYAW